VAEAPVPAQIGEYAVAARVGIGGEGVVYRAHSPGRRPVAVKVRHREHADAGFDEEYELAARLDAAITAAPIEHGHCALGAYLVTAWLDGYERLRPTWDIDRLWRLVGGIADCIAATNAAGVVHCDVKPDNLMVCGDDIRLIDFGIARDARAPQRISRYVQCSRGWAAPEQLSADPVSPAADVFAWGCVTVYLATGATPYSSRTDREWVTRLRTTMPDLTRVPPGLSGLVAAALHPRPRCRPTAADLASACRARRFTGRAPVRRRYVPDTRAAA
jgi:serine/threonine protein kinase